MIRSSNPKPQIWANGITAAPAAAQDAFADGKGG